MKGLNKKDCVNSESCIVTTGKSESGFKPIEIYRCGCPQLLLIDTASRYVRTLNKRGFGEDDL